MNSSFRLPDLGEGVHEAEILVVQVKPGQAVTEGDIIIEVETDKAAVEIPSPFTATVNEIRVQPGDTATVGDILMIFSDATLDGEQQPENMTSKEVQHPPNTPARRKIVPASPSTRRLARELNIDLHEVTPTGSAGLVTRQDVLAFAKSRPESAVIQPKTQNDTQTTKSQKDPVIAEIDNWGPTERVPFRSVRRATAKKMTASWSQIPHVHCQDSIDITRLEAFRQKHKEDIEAAGGRLTLTIFAVKAVATALKNYPYFNSSLDPESQEIVLKHYFHIGIAVDTKNGLMVPVVRDVDRKSIKELAIETNEAIHKVRTGTHTRELLQGGTFTITNAGALGGSHFSAIINHPEAAILGLGEARMQPAVITDERGRHEIKPRLFMPVMLCFDHRVVDGADAIRFLRIIIEALQDPDELLITMI